MSREYLERMCQEDMLSGGCIGRVSTGATHLQGWGLYGVGAEGSVVRVPA